MPPAPHILFIHPWIYDFTAYDFWIKPLGLMYMASIVEAQTSARVSFIDCLDRTHPGLPKGLRRRADGRGVFFKQTVTKPAVLGPIPRRFSRYGIPIPLFRARLDDMPPPDLVMLTCAMTYWYPGIQLAVELIRERYGPVPVILGGIYASLCPDHAERESGADFVLAGPGENGVLPLLREALGDRICISSCRYPALQDLPPPAFHLLPDMTTLALMTSRGCPYACSYCASRRLYPDVEQSSPDKVVELIQHLILRFNPRHIAFYDEALLWNKNRHIRPILMELIRLQLPVTFHVPNGLHVREVDGEIAELLYRARVRSIHLSQESLDSGWLQKTGTRKVLPKDLPNALRHLERAGYRRGDIGVYLLAGMPGQTAGGIRESIRQVLELGARPRLAYFSAVPNTREWESMVERGQLTAGADPLLHNKLAAPYVFSTMTHEDFLELKQLSLQRPSLG
jgi:radical SAM superfamily enzyme YgiQ (UPF0313 family)